MPTVFEILKKLFLAFAKTARGALATTCRRHLETAQVCCTGLGDMKCVSQCAPQARCNYAEISRIFKN